jgi:hypothetical protein
MLIGGLLFLAAKEMIALRVNLNRFSAALREVDADEWSSSYQPNVINQFAYLISRLLIRRQENYNARADETKTAGY